MKIRNFVFKNSYAKAMLVCTCILLLFWLPYFLTFFPGNVSYDTLISLKQAVGDSTWSMHHPLIFTLFTSVIYRIGKMFQWSINVSVAIMTCIQMLLFAGTLSYLFLWVLKRCNKKSIPILTAIFIFLNPTFAIFATELGKDTFFCVWMIWYVLMMRNVIQKKETYLNCKKNFLLWDFFSFMVILGRSNGIFIVFITSVVLLIREKRIRKNITKQLVTLLIFYIMIQKVLIPYLEIIPTSFAESVSVPIQQIAYSITEDGTFDTESEEYLEKLLPLERWKELYLPQSTDPIKFSQQFNDKLLNETKGQFLIVWAKNLPRNFPSYVKAYLWQTEGYWSINSIPNISNLEVVENDLNLYNTDVISLMGMKSLKPLFDFLMKVVTKLPVLRLIHNLCFMVLIMVVTWLIRFFRTGKKQIIEYVPMIVLWITLLIASPLSTQFRYMFPIFALYPYFLVIMGESKDDFSQKA